MKLQRLRAHAYLQVSIEVKLSHHLLVVIYGGILLSFTVKPGQCNRDQFRCKNGECIPSGFVCDRVADCVDHSDEGDLAECRK